MNCNVEKYNVKPYERSTKEFLFNVSDNSNIIEEINIHSKMQKYIHLTEFPPKNTN